MSGYRDGRFNLMNGFPWADIALIENTALKGAQIAVAYAKLAMQQSAGPGYATAVRP